MTSKVLVKLPVVPFQQQRKKPPADIAPLPSRNDEYDEGRVQGQNYSDKVTQLEQNIKFLQDQHQTTLVSLHQEVDILRQRNRDLQFQLVFSKGTNYASSSPSSPEDSSSGFVKPKQASPGNVNTAPLQVELLEKELQELRASLVEVKTRNVCLAETVERQKQKLELVEKSKEKQKECGVQVDPLVECREVELQARLDDAEALVRRLRLENEEQRAEISNLCKSASQPRASQGRGYQQRSEAAPTSPDESYHKFPPLHTQSYWHRGSARAATHGYEHRGAPQSDYRRSNRHHQQQTRQQLDLDEAGSVLPQLHPVTDGAAAAYPTFFRQQTSHHNGGNYHNRTDEQQNFRRYRGKKSRKDFTQQDRGRVFQPQQQYEQSAPSAQHDNPRGPPRQFSDSSRQTRRQQT